MYTRQRWNSHAVCPLVIFASLLTLTGCSGGGEKGPDVPGRRDETACTEDCEETPAVEECNGEDDDGDGEVDEGFDPEWYCRDLDHDGYGGDDCAWRCEPDDPEDRWTTAVGDCDDGDDDIHPDASERCDVVDNDCDGTVDERFETGTIYVDDDGDGHGDPAQSAEGCLTADGWSELGDDCDDDTPRNYPGNVEECDFIDNDCDGVVDDGLEGTLYADEDRDGFGDPRTIVGEGCSAETYGLGIADNTDCLDHSPDAHPGGIERCASGIDEDCDGLQDCEDEDCEGNGNCGEYTCDDHLDDEDDGYIDCDDDECWGDEACPKMLVSHVTGGPELFMWRSPHGAWRRDTCTWDSGSSVETSSQWHAAASQVEGVLRVYEPGAPTVLSCSWGFERIENRYYHRWVHRSSSSASEATDSQIRSGFWIASGCGVYDSAFLPTAQVDHELWLERYPYLSGTTSHTARGDGTGYGAADCSHYGTWYSVTYIYGRPLGVGERFVYEP